MEIPEVLGNYKIIRKIGKGGMADIFMATFTSSGDVEKRVALKVLRPEFAEKEEFIKSFITEAKLAALMEHPNIVPVYELGEMKNIYFMVMELLRSKNLMELLHKTNDKHDLTPALSAYIISKVCAGIHYAHRQSDLRGQPLRLIHRDLSPHNILLSREGEVKLTDFGVAKSVINLMKSHPFVLKGKVNYMSPEQFGSNELDQRSDIFSIGVVLYEMLCYRPAFDGNTEMGVMTKIKEGAYPKPREVNQNVPKEYAEVVERAMAHDPKDRYQTAEELQLVLEDLYMSALRHPQIGLRDLLDNLFPDSLDTPGAKIDTVEEVFGNRDVSLHSEGGTKLSKFLEDE